MTDTISKTEDVVQVTDDTPQIDHPEATAASWAAMPAPPRPLAVSALTWTPRR